MIKWVTWCRNRNKRRSNTIYLSRTSTAHLVSVSQGESAIALCGVRTGQSINEASPDRARCRNCERAFLTKHGT